MKPLLPLIAAALCVSAATSASAVTVLGATQVQITDAVGDYLQVAEVRALDYVGKDVAYAGFGGTVSAPDQYSAVSQPSNAIDGLYPRSYYDTPGIYHSAGAGGLLNVFFSPTNLASLTIYGRTDCCNGRDVYNVSIFNAGHDTLYSGVLDARGGSATATFDRLSPVPEPASWAFMIMGFGMAGAVLRTRRRAVAA